MNGNPQTAIDLFCGAGGLSEGFRQAGFDVLAGNDIDPFAAQTFAASHPRAQFMPSPMENLSASDFFDATGLRMGELDCLIGGPPCQAFSVYNHKRGLHDKRSGLFYEYLRIVEGLKPNWVVLENVTGIRSAGGGQAVAGILAGLADLGYRAETRILRAEEYVQVGNAVPPLLGRKLAEAVLPADATIDPTQCAPRESSQDFALAV